MWRQLAASRQSSSSPASRLPCPGIQAVCRSVSLESRQMALCHRDQDGELRPQSEAQLRTHSWSASEPDPNPPTAE